MNESALRELLARIASGGCTVEEAIERLKLLPFEDLGFAKVDHHRSLRCGCPEVVLCQGKTPGQTVSIVRAIRGKGHTVLATRADEPTRLALGLAFRPDGVEANELARTVVVGPRLEPSAAGTVAIVTAGTGDVPVAEEARVTAEVMGSPTVTVYDAGVAGLHRLLGSAEVLRSANVIVVVAGMEGALPSVVGGLVECPVIAVPTSIGYGASLGGLAALLAMLNSCAAGLAVVNIDNGFGAGYLAALINRRTSAGRGA
jgi:hypothetical protein